MLRPTRTSPRSRDERGIALLLTILGIVVLGALLSGFFMSAMLENRAGQNSRRAEQAFAAAEYGVTETIADWDVTLWNALPVMGADTVSGTSPGGSGTYSGTVQRINNEIFLVDVTGQSARGQARQRIGAFVKLRTLVFDIQAVLTTRGKSKIGGNATVDGNDRVPGGWVGCPGLEPPTAGIRIPEDDDLQFIGGCSGASCITGSPKIDEDPGITDETFFNYQDSEWDALRLMSTIQLPGGTYTNMGPRLDGGGDCDVTHSKNWGDPLNAGQPCSDYFPIIYINGDAHLSTGVGQGLLLVNGDLEVQGNFEFYGIVVAREEFELAGTGNKFSGGVLAANVDLDDNSLIGTADLVYSSCAVARAQAAGAAGSPLRSRSWVQLF
jgi:hypothetical protein